MVVSAPTRRRPAVGGPGSQWRLLPSPGVAMLSVFGVPGLPEIGPDVDLARLIVDAAASAGTPLADRDVVVVTSKVVSKAEGRVLDLDDVEPSVFATEWSTVWDKDPRVTEVVLRESRRVVRQLGPVLITETHHGFVCANSGVDQSSSGAHGRVVLLPADPDASARRLRTGFRAAGVDVAVIVSDTFGRAWREGQTDIAIGVAGIQPIFSYIGQVDPHGHEFKVQAICTADELAGAAELVKGNISRVPVAVVRGHEFELDDTATIAPVLRDLTRDLFR
jgi:coenzyme F420-0:L-glutamate ligase/coenzyme F420-1:gamma-L-glutamate ligase